MEYVKCQDCLRRVTTDEDYMNDLDCYGRKISHNCLVTDEELKSESYKTLVCKEFIENDEPKTNMPEIENLEEITNNFFDKYTTKKDSKEVSMSPKQALKQLWDNSIHRPDMISRNVVEANEEDLVLYNIILKALE
jgi:hypothetical protein